ncbi:L,D-transpeptidase family protein [Streptomyces palmae]|uniref:Murein L,D-transpeptidase n=1 Tax=Streptomyces palmae TaxID=1701085 RepID=A0A4Z0H1V4_9ACTN|nr:L,D-transpeptidase [Streptomyces palmae]TGB03240.1 murein L,D-transpeptidase [Streptomyces palmae]
MRAGSAVGRRARRAFGVGLGLAGVVGSLTVGLAAAPAQAAPACTAAAGPYQKQAEKFLKLPVDGRQSARDCTAIRTFQTVNGIAPAAGYAGPVTWSVMKRQQSTGDRTSCPTNKGRIACVDLTRQISWIQDGGKRIHEPVPVRTGRNGYETRTGLHKIYWRHKNHVSSIYHVAMPYSQFFDGGQAFHSISGNIYSPPGSHGCVNMRPADAASYWKLLTTGDDVLVYGRKPGT